MRNKFNNLVLVWHAVFGGAAAFLTTFAMVGTVAASLAFGVAGAAVAYSVTNQIPQGEE